MHRVKAIVFATFAGLLVACAGKQHGGVQRRLAPIPQRPVPTAVRLPALSTMLLIRWKPFC